MTRGGSFLPQAWRFASRQQGEQRGFPAELLGLHDMLRVGTWHVILFTGSATLPPSGTCGGAED